MHASEVAAQEYCENVQNRAHSKGPPQCHMSLQSVAQILPVGLLGHL